MKLMERIWEVAFGINQNNYQVFKLSSTKKAYDQNSLSSIKISY